ncbi:MAG: nucleotidyltransferase domain-containing protein [Oscillospiraceae bacterium]|nr:nucleotidyltransferase domain-containing protein [Oscillospiraceae bacterium]
MLDKREVRDIAAKYTDRIRMVYNPKQVIVFGSYINGNPHTESDIDIAIIFDSVEGDWLETWGDLIGLREGISYDIETHMLDETCNRSGFLDHIRQTGEIIYQAV